MCRIAVGTVRDHSQRGASASPGIRRGRGSSSRSSRAGAAAGRAACRDRRRRRTRSSRSRRVRYVHLPDLPRRLRRAATATAGRRAARYAPSSRRGAVRRRDRRSPRSAARAARARAHAARAARLRGTLARYAASAGARALAHAPVSSIVFLYFFFTIEELFLFFVDLRTFRRRTSIIRVTTSSSFVLVGRSKNEISTVIGRRRVSHTEKLLKYALSTYHRRGRYKDDSILFRFIRRPTPA